MSSDPVKMSSSMICRKSLCLKLAASFKIIISECWRFFSKSCKTTKNKTDQKEIPFPCLLNKKGSITVEASLVLPLFVMVMASFLFYFEFMTLQANISTGLNVAGFNVAEIYHLETVFPEIFDGPASEEEQDDIKKKIYEYAGDLLATGITSAYVKKEVLDYSGKDYINSSIIKNGEKGLICYGYTEGNILKLGVSYQVCIPFLPAYFFSFDVKQQITRRVWTGVSDSWETEEASKEGEESKENCVYVTVYGKVYHLYLDCQALKRTISTTPLLTVGNTLNSNGAHYYPCELCIHGSANVIVYITEDGVRYNNSSSCQALKRTISEVPLSEVGDKRLCSFCSKMEKIENEKP